MLGVNTLEELYYLIMRFQYPVYRTGITGHQWCMTGIATPVEYQVLGQNHGHRLDELVTLPNDGSDDLHGLSMKHRWLAVHRL